MGMRITNTVVHPDYIYEAILGARLSYGSGPKSDSVLEGNLTIGPEDEKLCKKLIFAGAGHSKFLRTIPVSARIEASTIWWRQFDQHKVGTTTSSESTMHRLRKRGEFTPGDFDDDPNDPLFIAQLDALNEAYHDWEQSGEDRRGKRWERWVKKVPASFLYLRHTSLNYEVLRNIWWQRKNHRWDDWAVFLDWVDTLPHSKLLITLERDSAARAA